MKARFLSTVALSLSGCLFVVITGLELSENDIMAPLPVLNNFASNCSMQLEYSPTLKCSDRLFNQLQCVSGKCFCVDIQTGIRISDRIYPREMENQINCETVERCEEQSCPNVCPNGHIIERGCKTCNCKDSFQKCLNIKNFVASSNCACGCVVMPTGHPLVRLGNPNSPASASSCLSCNTTCNRTMPSSFDECSVRSANECVNGSALIIRGIFGSSTCVSPLQEGSKCAAEDKEDYGAVRQTMRVSSQTLSRILTPSQPPCAAGLVCKPKSPTYQVCMKETKGQCVMEQARDSSIDCDPYGFFQPIQCRAEVGSPVRCRCVNIRTGETLPNSERAVSIESDKPYCLQLPGLNRCLVSGLNNTLYSVSHGKKYFNLKTCQTCQCVDGNGTAVCSPQGSCKATRQMLEVGYVPRNCFLENGTSVRHDSQETIGCNVCGCRDGKLMCTRKSRAECHRVQKSLDECDKCKNEPRRPVCGPDSRTYHSPCIAIRCAGIPAPELQHGACSSLNGCFDYPCGGDDVCINTKGKEACLGKCKPEHVRRCIPKVDLQCQIMEVDLSSTPTSRTLCGTDNITYNSICDLIQTGSNIGILYAGACSGSICETKELCGSDGQTYNSLCELRNQAAVRLDYNGRCITGSRSREETCLAAINGGRCAISSDNCDVMVAIDGSCCPICGGSIEVIVDENVLLDASGSNPDIITTETFAEALLGEEDLENYGQNCVIDVSLNSVRNLQINFNAKSNSKSHICHDYSRMLEALIMKANGNADDAQTKQSQRKKRQVEMTPSLPIAYSYTVAGSRAANISQSDLTIIEASILDDGGQMLKGCIAILVPLLLSPPLVHVHNFIM